MNETEFLDLLRYYFRNGKPEEVKEILSDYESHFEEGKKRGLTEEQIAKELGSPRDIYDSYQSEGVVDERTKTGQLKDNALKIAKDAQDRAAKTWTEVSPKLPGAAETTARMTARLLNAAGIIMAIVVLAAAGLVIGLFSTSLTPFHGMAPLPRFSFLTLASIGSFGLFTALSIYLIAREGSQAIENSFKASSAKGGDSQ
ncbi:DUF1700 domain-containing protein [uncultured Dialister sp.]|uniref:DUF1700 domain-containing protein n=1 Tax=uncultured Dialister sp. TaxID=278064 RepID=UPI0026034ED3|nr:DUF1700 domain-containing protein [uncultured Dialister sp.]